MTAAPGLLVMSMLCAACAASAVDVPAPAAPRPIEVVVDAPMVSVLADAEVEAGPPAAPVVATAQAGSGEVWLRGSTHVHAKPSGDSSEPIPDVIAWYEAHGYDFIVLTDHNKVSEVAPGSDTAGQPFVRDPDNGLIVLAGTELTHNPSGCVPAGDKSKKCRIHVNAIGVTARPVGKIDWANRKTHDRIEKYQAALDEVAKLGAPLAQLNHPQWFWGMTPGVLIELAHRGVKLVEIANAQFPKWNAGDKDHPSMEQLWDDALVTGATLWGIASDDAHDYHGHGPWPPGGGWIVVHARRDPRAILDAIAAGHFYASSGVKLVHAEPDGNELVVEVAPGEPGTYAIAWIENGKLVDTVTGTSARRAIPATGYVRAVVTRDDGARAWVQPARWP